MTRFAILAVAMLCSTGCERSRSSLANIPLVKTSQLDPLVGQLINKSVGEVRVSPKSGAAWGKLGMVFHNYEFEREAKHAYAVAEQLDPAKATWPYLHALLLRTGNTALAISKMERALGVAGDRAGPIRLRLAEMLIEAGRFGEAQRHLKESVGVDALQPVASLLRARSALASGNHRSAIELVAPALQDPQTAKRAYQLLALCHQRLGHRSASQAAAETASKLPAHQPWPDPYLAQLDQFRTGLRMWVEDAQAFLNRGSFQEALALATRATQQYPNSAEAWLVLGKTRYQLQDCKGAEDALRRHLSIQSESVNGHAVLGVALLCQNRFEDAVPHFQQAVRLKPDFAEAHFNLGFALARLGRTGEAIAAFRAATQYSPGYTEAYVNTADLLYQSGDVSGAQIQLRHALDLNPTHERALTLLTRIVDSQ